MNQAAAPSEPGNAAHLAVEHRYFVASKLSAPPRRPGIVDRPILLNHLRNLSHPGVVLVSAPAGYGKTTLLALWREFDERPFGWVTLDSADNDPVVLVASVLAALDPILHLDPDIRNALTGPEPPLEEFVLPALVALGRRAEAATRLEEAETLLSTRPDAGKLPDWYRETVRTLRLHERRPQPPGELSEAELRVLHLLNSDLTVAEIGRELYLSRNTVKNHLNSIYHKLGVSSRSEVTTAVKANTSQPS
jgi:LuxR family maltose regulon positive regulatory protein